MPPGKFTYSGEKRGRLVSPESKMSAYQAEHQRSGSGPLSWRSASPFYSFLLLLLASCTSLPTLEDRPNLLTTPPGGNERASDASSEPTTAAPGASPNQLTQGEEPIQLGPVQSTPPAAPEPPPSAVPSPSLADNGPLSAPATQIVVPAGVLKGEFEGTSLALSDADGLVCAGRLIGNVQELHKGIKVPVNCNDGSTGSVKITDLTVPDQAQGVLVLGNTKTTPVLLIKSAKLD